MNKKGFIAVSIIFSFFIVFLLLLTINLTAYAQNRILLNQVKKDIKYKILLDYQNSSCNITSEKIDDGVKIIVNNTMNSDDNKYLYSFNDLNYSETNELLVTVNGTYNAKVKYTRNSKERIETCNIIIADFN